MSLNALTMDEFKEALPPDMRSNINPLLMMKINNVLDHPEEWEQYRENLLTYTNVLLMGKFKMEAYINAVRYVGFKVMGLSNTRAHAMTFPERHIKWAQEGLPSKTIASYTTAYNKSKLVNLIYEQTLIPTYILNAPIIQKAINVQVEIMSNEDNSAKVRSEAANYLMTHLKPPETKKVELDIGVASSSVIEDYEAAMARLVEKQMEVITRGGNVKEVANTPIRIPQETSKEVIDI